MNTRDPKLIALQFNEHIGRHDVEGLARLMTEDHAFVDQDGTRNGPRDRMVQLWREFFAMYPDYRNTFTRVHSVDNVVAMLGSAYWSEKQPHDPAIWTATIVNDLVQEWRIYEDSETNRRALHLA